MLAPSAIRCLRLPKASQLWLKVSQWTACRPLTGAVQAKQAQANSAGRQGRQEGTGTVTADRGGRGAAHGSRVDWLALPTLAGSESWRDDRPDSAAARGVPLAAAALQFSLRDRRARGIAVLTAGSREHYDYAVWPGRRSAQAAPSALTRPKGARWQASLDSPGTG